MVKGLLAMTGEFHQTITERQGLICRIVVTGDGLSRAITGLRRSSAGDGVAAKS
jgi:hypothetical protein